MAKGLADLRTAITTRVHSKPHQKGTAHLDIYLLSKERERLEKELARLDQQQRRTREHLREIRKAMDRLGQETEREETAKEPSPRLEAEGKETNPPPPSGQRPWKKMPLHY